MSRLKPIVASLVLLGGFFIAGCASKDAEILTGEHQLRKMMERTETNSNVSGSFFLFFGNLNSETNTTVSLKFAWKLNDGTYAISSLPLEKIRLKFDERIATPTINFVQSKRLETYENIELQELLNNYVSYAVITVRESDWPIQINLPLNQ